MATKKYCYKRKNEFCNNCKSKIIFNGPTTKIEYCSQQCCIEDKYTITTQGCWEWKTYKEKSKDKFRFSYKNISMSARKSIMEQHGIIVPNNHCIKNTCSLKSCIKFEHLEIISREDLIKKHGQEIADKYFNHKWTLKDLSELYNVSQTIILKRMNGHLKNTIKKQLPNTDEDAQKELERIQKELGL